MNKQIAPSLLLECWTPDAVAECLPVPSHLYDKIWDEIVPLTEGKNAPYPGEIPDHVLAAYWDKFTSGEKLALNKAVADHEAEIKRICGGE
jgi:hypothetical protein